MQGQTIATSKVQVSLGLDYEVELLLLLQDLRAYAVHLSQLGHVGFEELYAAIRIQCLAFVDDALGSFGIAANDVDMRRGTILHESLSRPFPYS